MKLASLVSLIGASLSDSSKALELYKKVLTSRSRLGPEASMCLDMDTILVQIKMGELDTAKEGLEAAKEKLPSIKPTESVVFSKFYMATAEYRKVRAESTQ